MLKDTAGQLIPDLARYQRQFLIAGIVGGLVSLVGLFLEPRQFLQSYLMAYMFVLGLTLGCLALGMVHQLSGGAWGVVIRRPIGAATRVLPIVTILFLPIALGMHQLYTWTDPRVWTTDPALVHKHLYLNTPFWLCRAGLYFALWNALTYYLNRWSLEQDRTGDPLNARRMQQMSGGGLVFYGLTITFASFDWLMSLEPHWFSTVYGMIIMSGEGLAALAFLLLALAWLSRRPPLDGVIVPSHFHDLGNLTLAFVMLWAYMSFSQFLIIWAGNLPEEIAWYMHRLHTGWRVIGLGLMLFHFAVPFALLLSRTIKRQVGLIVRVAALILVVRVVEYFWLIAPEFHPDGVHVSWLDILLPLTLFSVWLGCFIWQLRGRALLPVHDPQFDEALGRILERGQRPSTAQ